MHSSFRDSKKVCALRKERRAMALTLGLHSASPWMHSQGPQFT